LPLTTDVGVAVRDYILNSRPESSLANVFLRTNAPIREVSHPILYGQFNSYRAKIGLPKCSFHGLRRALGSNMVISGAPVTIVAQVLGHSDIDSTKQYISLDTIHLKECALDFTGIAPKAGRRGGAR
jgi:integrase